MKRLVFPNDDYGKNSVLMQIDSALLPIIVDKIYELIRPSQWIDIDNYHLAYNAIARTLIVQTNIVDSIDRLYRLLDAALNGTTYSVAGTVVTPAIPDAPTAVDGLSSGLRKQLFDLQGVTPSAWPFGFGDKPATLADIASALKQQSPTTVDSTKQLMADLSEISTIEGGVSAATGVVNMLSGWLDTAVEGTGDGLMITTTLAVAAAQAAIAGLAGRQIDTLISKIDRLITSLDGGATPAPAANVISQLTAANYTLTAIDEDSTSSIASEIINLRTAIAAILAAIGTLAGKPANYTVKELLELLQTSIDVPPPGKIGEDLIIPSMPDPQACTGSWSFVACALNLTYKCQIQLNNVNYWIYAPLLVDWPFHLARYEQDYTVLGISSSSININPNRTYEICLSWDFTDVSYSPGVLIALTNGGAQADWPDGITDMSPFLASKSNANITLSSNPTSFTVRIAIPYGGDPPAPNFWIRARMVV